MKCNKCGQNEATYFHRTNINGVIDEVHLCGACAAASSQTIPRDFFADFERVFAPFEPPRRTPMLGLLPMFLVAAPEPTESRADNHADSHNYTCGTACKDDAAKIDPDMSRMREVNIMREQLRTAIECENFEHAAKLRDRLREIEKPQ